MRKLQQFHILKINSSRLKETNYKIKKLTLNEARLNGETISLSQSQVIRTIQKLTNKLFSQYELDKLLEEKKFLSRKKNSVYHRERISVVHSQIDQMLYIPEIISVFFEDKRHFYNILDRDGFLVNGIRYVPFMASAGMIRRDTYLFIDERYKKQITEIFDNNRNTEIESVPAKFMAYFSLYSSSTLDVTFPKIAVVPDLTITTLRTVDFATYQGVGIDPIVSETQMELECNAFDGQGLCSPNMARKWARDLEIDYTPSVIGVRAPFLKGMLVVFDFHKFGKEIANSKSIIDIYGNTIDLSNVECIISESMFKLWSSYTNTFDYTRSCLNNDLDWGITKVNAKYEKNHARTSYQFLQVLDSEKLDIEKLCEPTLNWLGKVSGNDPQYSLLYSLGENEFSEDWFQRLDSTLQAFILNNDLIKDNHFVHYFDKSLTRKKNDAKIGRLIFNGNYQVMISDPFAFAAHMFGMEIKPLLQEGEHFSAYWNKQSKSQVVSIRSPIVHSSEVNVLNLKDDFETDKWYNHIQSGIVFPANGIGMDSAIQGGSDFDLDLVCTIDSPEIIKSRIEGLPILYATNKASKTQITPDNERIVIESQVAQIKTNKIGFLTNVSSAMYALLAEFSKDSLEHTAILQRLKYGRVLQGLAIDAAKGILTDKFPEHFVKWKKPSVDMTEAETFNNSIVANKRPYFMRWLYSHYNRRYLKELSVYDNISETKWGISFDTLRVMSDVDLTDEQRSLIATYKKKSFFMDNNSTMNRITKYIERQLRIQAQTRRITSKDFDYTVLLSSGFKKPSKFNLDKMKLLFKEFKSLKRSLKEYVDGNYDDLNSILAYINHKAYASISSNEIELADMAVYLCYKELGKNSKTFCWSVFGKEIVKNMLNKHTDRYVRVPIVSPTGAIDYLWGRYGIFLLNIDKEIK